MIIRELKTRNQARIQEVNVYLLIIKIGIGIEIK